MVFNRHCLWRLNPSGACALLRRTKSSEGRVFELATSTMSRLTELATTRYDSLKLSLYCDLNNRINYVML